MLKGGILINRVGHWQECLLKKEHKKVNMYFWKTPDYKYEFCHLCLFAIQKENGTLQSAPMRVEIKERRTPEKDSL